MTQINEVLDLAFYLCRHKDNYRVLLVVENYPARANVLRKIHGRLSEKELVSNRDGWTFFPNDSQLMLHIAGEPTCFEVHEVLWDFDCKDTFAKEYLNMRARLK